MIGSEVLRSELRKMGPGGGASACFVNGASCFVGSGDDKG